MSGVTVATMMRSSSDAPIPRRRSASLRRLGGERAGAACPARRSGASRSRCACGSTRRWCRRTSRGRGWSRRARARSVPSAVIAARLWLIAAVLVIAAAGSCAPSRAAGNRTIRNASPRGVKRDAGRGAVARAPRCMLEARPMQYRPSPLAGAASRPAARRSAPRARAAARYVGVGINPPTTARLATDVLWYLYHENVSSTADAEASGRCCSRPAAATLRADRRCAVYQSRPHVCRSFDNRSCDVNDPASRRSASPSRAVSWLGSRRRSAAALREARQGFVPERLSACRGRARRARARRAVARRARI